MISTVVAHDCVPVRRIQSGTSLGLVAVFIKAPVATYEFIATTVDASKTSVEISRGGVMALYDFDFPLNDQFVPFVSYHGLFLPHEVDRIEALW